MSINTRTLQITNNSRMKGSFCIFAEEPDTNTPDAGMSVCMLSQRVSTQEGTVTTFSWKESISAFWSSTKPEHGGVVESMGALPDMNYDDKNHITLSHSQGAHSFEKLRSRDYTLKQSEGDGMLFIEQDGTVPKHTGCVGIAIGGRGTFVLPTEPNMTYNFTPKLRYWVSFADYIPGEIVDISLHNNEIYQFQFGANVQQKSIVFNIHNKFVD